MHIVSSEYKKAMDAYLRDRGYIRVTIGVIAQEAHASATVDLSKLAYWSSDTTLFDTEQIDKPVYATMEQNFAKADGKMLFMPEEGEYIQDTGVATIGIKESITISFDNVYSLKGLTLDFGDNYPTKFNVKTSDDRVFTFELDNRKFITTTKFGDTSSLTITPITMLGGQQRLRIVNAIIGVGLSYGNNDIQDASYEEFISMISEEISYNTLTVNILDPNNIYNVDSDDTFINFLQTGQEVNISEGITLEDGTIEWIKIARLYLNEWSSIKGRMTFTAVDKFSQMDDEYTLGDKIYSRTAYFEAEQILQDMGFEPDEYDLDDYLKDIRLLNPMPKGTHKECLQILANACRCIVFQDYNGKIIMRSNFALVVDPDELEIDTNGVTHWSIPQNVVLGVEAEYADMTQNFARADGQKFFAPENGEVLLESGYVSQEIADELGVFSTNPMLSVQFPSSTTYYGIILNFGGNNPNKVHITSYYNKNIVDSVEFTGLENENILYHDWDVFDYMTFEFSEGAPYNRVVIDKLTFGDFSDYILKKQNCFSDIYGTKEEITKSVSVKIYTYEAEYDDAGEYKGYKEVDDDVWHMDILDSVGQRTYVENPLIHTEAMAKDLAEWLGIYYKNNTTYDVQYRGDPRLNATDVIHVESDFANNLQALITTHNLTFNGAWRGTLAMRKAMTQKATS